VSIASCPTRTLSHAAGSPNLTGTGNWHWACVAEGVRKYDLRFKVDLFYLNLSGDRLSKAYMQAWPVGQRQSLSCEDKLKVQF